MYGIGILILTMYSSFSVFTYEYHIFPAPIVRVQSSFLYIFGNFVLRIRCIYLCAFISGTFPLPLWHDHSVFVLFSINVLYLLYLLICICWTIITYMVLIQCDWGVCCFWCEMWYCFWFARVLLWPFCSCSSRKFFYSSPVLVLVILALWDKFRNIPSFSTLYNSLYNGCVISSSKVC